MAAVQERNGSYRVVFLHEGKQHVLILGRVSEPEAKASQVDYLLMRLKQGLVTLPPGVDIVAFVRQRLVRSALVALLPSTEVVEARLGWCRWS